MPIREKQNNELEEIKKLLILQLYKNGVSTNEIGGVLDVSGKTIERMIPIKKKGRGRTK